MNILTVEHLSVKYATAHSTITSVDDVSFEIKSGETLGLAGESAPGSQRLQKPSCASYRLRASLLVVRLTYVATIFSVCRPND